MYSAVITKYENEAMRQSDKKCSHTEPSVGKKLVSHAAVSYWVLLLINLFDIPSITHDESLLGIVIA